MEVRIFTVCSKIQEKRCKGAKEDDLEACKLQGPLLCHTAGMDLLHGYLCWA